MSSQTKQYAGVGIGEAGFAAACARARMACRDFFGRDPVAELPPSLDYFQPSGITCPACPRNSDCCQAPPKPSLAPVALELIADIEAPALALRIAHLEELASFAWEAE